MIDCRVKAATLLTFFKAINACADEVKLHYAKDGIHVRAVDPANVLMVNATLPRASFFDYQFTMPPAETMMVDPIQPVDLGYALDGAGHIVKPPINVPLVSTNRKEDYEYGIDVKRFVNFVKNAKFKEDVRVTANIVPSEAGILDGSVSRIPAKTYAVLDGPEASLKYSLFNASSVRKEPKVPYLELPGYAEVSAKWFHDGVKAIRDLQKEPFVIITLNQDGLTLLGETENDELRFNTPIKNLRAYQCPEQEQRSMFSATYLEKITRTIGQSTIRLKLGIDYPGWFGLTFEQMTVEYLLAPRIEDRR